MSAPPVTVLMAVYNGERHLREAVESVLGQTMKDFEFLVIDDGSTDGSPSILSSYSDPRLRVVRNERNLGLIASLNRGLTEARGEWIARADDDDVNDPRRLELQLAKLQRDAADICFAETVDIYPGGVEVPGPYGRLTWAQRRWLAQFRNAFGAHPAVCFRKEKIVALGGYSTEFFSSEDYELWDRCLAAGLEFSYLPERLVRHRIRPDNVSSRHAASQVEATARIRLRALRRVWPELTRPEADALGWLLKGYSAERLDGPVEHINLAREFIERYLAQVGPRERKEIKSAIRSSLLRRIRKTPRISDRAMIARLLLNCIR